MPFSKSAWLRVVTPAIDATAKVGDFTDRLVIETGSCFSLTITPYSVRLSGDSAKILIFTWRFDGLEHRIQKRQCRKIMILLLRSTYFCIHFVFF